MAKLKCTACGNEHNSTREYYATKSPIYNGIGRVTICKSCIEQRYKDILGNLNNEVVAANKLFSWLDVYFDEDLLESCKIKVGDKWIGEYMRIVNTNAKYKGLSSLDNNVIENVVVEDVSIDEIDDDLIDRWGERDVKDYKRLEKKYKKYIKKYPSNDLEQQVIIRTICELEIEKEICRKDKNYNSYATLDKRISEKMSELDIIPSKKKKYGEDKNLVYGKLIETIENEEPIPEMLEVFHDIDKFKYMLDRYFIKPFRKVFGLDKDIYTFEDENNDK